MIKVDITNKLSINGKEYLTQDYSLLIKYRDWCRNNLSDRWYMLHEVDGTLSFHFDYEEEAILFKLTNGI